MADVIFYFTGTGNSLAAARKLAAKLGDTQVMSIADLIEEDTIALPYERIGFAFPVYYATVPTIVRRFIRKLKFDASQYLYGVATFGAESGLVFEHLGRLVAESGGKLSAGFPLHMPGNYIIKYGAIPAAIQQKLFKNEGKKLELFADTVKNKTTTNPRTIVIFKLFERIDEKIIANFGRLAVNYHVTERCNGCGTCARVCPVHNINISLTSKHPDWGETCEQCMACIQWCPWQAIEYADKTQKRTRYRNPEITLSDMFVKSINGK